jgi:predicted hydrocarbon binding protein
MITEIVTESGVKMPKPRVVYAYPYEDMEVGDSFVVPLEARAKVLNANYRAGKRLGRAFVARTEGEVVRVWRML